MPDDDEDDKDLRDIFKKIKENEDDYPRPLLTGTRGEYVTIVRKSGDDDQSEKKEKADDD